MDAKLHLKVTPALVEATCGFVFQWALGCGLPKDRAESLTLAVDELVTDIVAFAFPESQEPQYFDLTLLKKSHELELVFYELGEPFDLEAYHYSADAFLNRGDSTGMGLFIIEHMVDGFVYLNHGPKGKEFRLIMALPSEPLDSEVLEAAQQEELSDSYQYQVRQAAHHDAETIAKLIFRTWGYSYPREEMYYPQKIKKLFQADQKFGVLVETEFEDAAGYFAVIHAPDSPIGEVAEAVVSPSHRGQGIMKMMMESLIEASRGFGLHQVFAEAITVHTHSQQVNQRYGFLPCALMLNAFPQLQAKGFDPHEQNRISVLIEALPLRPLPPFEVALDDTFLKWITPLAEVFELPVRQVVPATGWPESETTEVTLELQFKFKMALLICRSAGQDFQSVAGEHLQQLRDRGYAGIYFDLPLSHPVLNLMVHALHELGCFVAGVFPLAHHGRHYLRMQWVANLPEPENIHIHAELGQTIKQYVFEDAQQWLSRSM